MMNEKKGQQLKEQNSRNNQLHNINFKSTKKMAYTKTTKTSYGSRVKSSCAGIGGGFILCGGTKVEQ